MNEPKLAVDSFKFFYVKLIEATEGFDEIIEENTKFISASKLANPNKEKIEKEKQAYNNIKFIFSRLITEYHGVVRSQEGELPQEFAPMLEKICLTGELISQYEAIIQLKNKNKEEE